MRRNSGVLLGLLLCLVGGARAQEGDPRFGMEFEFAGRGNRIVRFEEMPFENYERLLRVVVEHFGGDPSTIRRVDFTKPTTLPAYPDGKRPLFKAEWDDPRGRTWTIEPEYVASMGLDGYELVTPVLDDTTDLERILDKLAASGLVREGLKSGVHLTVGGERLVGPGGDARALTNLILLHENLEPLLRRMFQPVRGGGHSNRFARSLAVDHPQLLEAIGALPAEGRTVEALTELFARYDAREAEIQGSKIGESSQSKMWKYRSLNLAKILPINPEHGASHRVVEFRMFDLGTPEAHRLQARLYRRLVRYAAELAARGERVTYRPRAPMPAGEDPSVYNTPQDAEEAKREARALLERLGLDPTEFEGLLERSIRPRELYTRAEFDERITTLGEGSTDFRYRFELRGKGWGVVALLQPIDPEVRARWGSMSQGDRRAYFERVVGDQPLRMAEHFTPDTGRFAWLSGQLEVDREGFWRLGSSEFSALGELEARLREAKALAGRSADAVQLSVRDTAPQWERLEGQRARVEAYFARAARWVFVRRVEALRTARTFDAGAAGSLHAQVRLNSLDRTSGVQHLDAEIVGLASAIEDVTTLARLVTHQLRAHAWGDFAGVPLDPARPSRLLEEYARHLSQVEGAELTETRKAIVEALAAGTIGASAEAIVAPLLPWAEESGLPETTRRELRYAKEDYLSWLHREVQRIEGGVYASDPALTSAEGLHEQTRIRLEIGRRVKAWFAESGLSDGLLRSLLPRSEPTAPRRVVPPKLEPLKPRAPEPPKLEVAELEVSKLEPVKRQGPGIAQPSPSGPGGAPPTVDRLAAWRTPHGRVDWKRFAREKSKVEAAGLAHFGLGLFLKELAVAVKTGDRLYVEEFFDALLTTDFYVEYGLFVAGARMGELTYTRYLQRYVKPRFVNSVLKTNLVLATGLALPALVHGRLEGKAFAISLGSLGLSSGLVHGGTRAIKWVVDLRKARTVGAASRTGLALGRLTRAGAWFYSAAELAVILYVADEFEQTANAYFDREAAKKAIGQAGEAFLDQVRDSNATPEAITAAAEAYDVAWTSYRDFLYAPLFATEAQVARRMEGLAETAKELADKRAEALARLRRLPQLRSRIERDHGSLEGYADHLVELDEASLQVQLDRILASYERERGELLERVYDGERRPGRYLTVDVDFLQASTRSGSIVWRRQLRDRPSPNRLQAYEDELEVLALAADLLAGRPALASALEAYAERVRATRAADDQLAHGDSGVVDLTPAKLGIVDQLQPR
ncbi:MAG: hypothetical protein KDD82_28395 [Planctomycetes bacterium]|nr:hypothetical protein [Planctomycetota bacterium]